MNDATRHMITSARDFVDALFLFNAVLAMVTFMTATRFGKLPLMQCALLFGLTAILMRAASWAYTRLLR